MRKWGDAEGRHLRPAVWLCWQGSAVYLLRSGLHDASHAATAGLCVLGLLQVGFCSRQSPPRKVRKEGEGTGTNLALDFSFSGCSLQLPTDLALSSTESHANVSTSAQHLTVP